jgi:hypothetical protein
MKSLNLIFSTTIQNQHNLKSNTHPSSLNPAASQIQHNTTHYRKSQIQHNPLPQISNPTQPITANLKSKHNPLQQISNPTQRITANLKSNNTIHHLKSNATHQLKHITHYYLNSQIQHNPPS